ncbi:MAG TPA: EAL domain-containing protein [Xanthomonadaceae bacterium]|jgi:diguanylate cyclase (GGDEF)-like protein|nr:EAL domain-containing protein [Xanthomonadaceae bacterium]
MNIKLAVQNIKFGQSIRWKLAAAFIAVACFVALFVGVAIAIQVQSIERAAQLEAAHVAELMADTVTDGNTFKPRLQDYITRLYSVQKRDFVIVDANQMGLADAHPDEVGMKYDTDLGDEVGKTIHDGRIRTFIEHDGRSPDVIRQLVVPIHFGATNMGAVILEYSQIREALFAEERGEFYLIVVCGIISILLVALCGFSVARRIAQPLQDLKNGVVRIAAEDYTARVVVTAHDEIGLLGTAFNRMAEDLGARAELVEFNNQLERKVSERTRELGESAIAAANMMEDARRQGEVIERAHGRINYLASYDPVTGLANQSLFLERLQEKLLSAKDEQRKHAVFVVDIERFKSINDAFGRKAGDDLLRHIAERLLQVGGGETHRFARMGADRFAITAADIDNAEQVGRYVEQRLDAVFRAPFLVAGSELRIAVKVGIALFPDDGADADTLLRNAEAALKKAKGTGERYVFFTAAMTARVVERLALENRLRQAIDKQEFVLHYQPKVDLTSGNLIGAEALIRWNDPKTGLVPPGMFIPILEETGLIHEVGRWALHKAIEDYLNWRNAGLAVVRIAVNVSPLQLRNRGFTAEIEQVLGVDADAAAGLELEITESLIMEDVKHSIASLQAIRSMGVTIAIDDFGTGFSSLSYLSRLPVDTLKIDRSFVNDMTATADGLALVSTIITLAHSLKLKVVAEGVETEEQSRLLRSLSCDEMQGFLFSRPVPADIFETKFLALIANAA